MGVLFNYQKYNECYDDLKRAILYLNKANSDINDGNKQYNKNNVYLSNIISKIRYIKNLYEDVKIQFEQLTEDLKLISNQQDCTIEDGFGTEFVNASDENDDVQFTEEDYINILNSLGIDSNGEISPEEFKKVFAECNLSDEDWEYINNQIDKGNSRAVIQRILISQARQDLEQTKKENEPRIAEIGNKLAKLYKCRNENGTNLFYRESWPSDIKSYDELIARISLLEQEQKALKQEIEQCARVLRTYENSNKEWEYDCYFNIVDSDSYDEINLYKEFFKQLILYYSRVDQQQQFPFKNYNESTMGTKIYQLIYDPREDSFFNWLKSSECNIENKDFYINYLTKLYDANDNYDTYDGDPSDLVINPVTYYLAAKELYDEGALKSQNTTVLQPGEVYYVSFFEKAFLNYDGFKQFNDELTYLAVQYFDEEHLKVYQYSYETEGQGAANAYLKVFKDFFNQQSGMEKAEKAFENIVNSTNDSYAFGFLSADWEGIKLGTEEWFDLVATILSKDGTLTDSEYAVMYLKNMLQGASYFVSLSEDDLDSCRDVLNESAYNALKVKINNDIRIKDNISSDNYYDKIELGDLAYSDSKVGLIIGKNDGIIYVAESDYEKGLIVSKITSYGESESKYTNIYFMDDYYSGSGNLTSMW